MRSRDLTDEANEAAALPWREPGLRPKGEDARPSLYRSALLDVFTLSHPAMPYLIGVPFAAICAWRAWAHGVGAGWGALLFVLGWAAWSLVEYLMHRFLFHARVESETLRIATLLAHGHHHVWPQDPRRIAATPVQLVSIALLFQGLFRLALGPDAWWAAMAGATVGYVAYELVHWVAHHGRPTTRVMRALHAHHMKHHHLAPGSRWGIGTPLWDWLFRSDR
ncbi:sterol desaturase family protein [Sandaracinus amylolyticus]|uniref:sterol desaturase family protein n=1 Tax=Sandaracinus amylolyticus TaxID=927083 RepID=UPI001F226040|nr:sterol desaturase family protein [Sandaracinus amylolyticus]UJR78315.1 Fatty acid hydroxylase [Sandaracinus amylolyticus]